MQSQREKFTTDFLVVIEEMKFAVNNKRLRVWLICNRKWACCIISEWTFAIVYGLTAYEYQSMKAVNYQVITYMCVLWYTEPAKRHE